MTTLAGCDAVGNLKPAVKKARCGIPLTLLLKLVNVCSKRPEVFFGQRSGSFGTVAPVWAAVWVAQSRRDRPRTCEYPQNENQRKSLWIGASCSTVNRCKPRICQMYLDSLAASPWYSCLGAPAPLNSDRSAVPDKRPTSALDPRTRPIRGDGLKPFPAEVTRDCTDPASSVNRQAPRRIDAPPVLAAKARRSCSPLTKPASLLLKAYVVICWRNPLCPDRIFSSRQMPRLACRQPDAAARAMLPTRASEANQREGRSGAYVRRRTPAGRNPR